MKFKPLLVLFILMLLSMSFSFAVTDSIYDEATQETFIINADTIELQKDQTELEKQSVIKETEYRVKLEARQRQINKIWELYAIAMILLYQIFIGAVIVAFARLLVFFLVDFMPLTIIKMIEVFTKWSKR